MYASMLHIIPTPIGNKEDITLRALRLLEELDVFFCEDTRTARKLFRLYDLDSIHKTFHALTSFSSEWRLLSYIQMMKEQDCWLLSEAWTPWLSDPWKEIVKLCWQHDVDFEVLPWANALIPAVIGSYVDTSKFVYLWFVPAKKWRKTFIESLSTYTTPVYAFESVHRIRKLVSQLVDAGYPSHVWIFRELTKKFEQKVYGTPEEILSKIDSEEIPSKWEYVVCFMND